MEENKHELEIPNIHYVKLTSYIYKMEIPNKLKYNLYFRNLKDLETLLSMKPTEELNLDYRIITYERFRSEVLENLSEVSIYSPRPSI